MKIGFPVLALLSVGPVVAATDLPDKAHPTGSTVIYTHEDLAQYDVGNAEDLLRRLPGGARLLEEASLVADKRGLGQSDEFVLIDGERLPSKANDVSSYLRLIPRDAVAQIEFISGAQNGGLVANVVLLENRASAASGTMETDLYFSDYGYVTLGGLLTYAGSARNWGYRVSAGVDRFGISDAGWADRVRYEVFADDSGQPRVDRPQKWAKRRTLYQTALNLEYRAADNSKLALNALLATSIFNENSTTNVTQLEADGQVSGSGTETTKKTLLDPLDYEVAATYAKPFGSQFELVLLALRGYDEQPLAQERWSCDDCADDDGLGRELSRNLTDTLAEENIFRGTLNWTGSKQTFVAVGVEVASNLLTQNLEVNLDRDGNGVAEPVSFPTAFATVDELRLEPFVSLKKTGEHWSTQVRLVGEYSSVSHNFDFAPRPSYRYLKPRIVVSYSPLESTVVELQLERRIGQLELTEFVPAFDFHDSEIEPGNPALKPEEIIVIESGITRRLANNRGNLELRAFYHFYTNHIDKRVIAEDASGNLVSANGDIGRARLYGGEIKLGLRLDAVGLRGPLVDARYRRNFSQTRDAFTGVQRRMKDEYESELAFRYRHDIDAFDLGYEFRYLNRRGDLAAHELSNLTRTWTGAVLDASIEKRLSRRFSIKLAGYGILGNREYRQRIIYADGAIEGTVLRRERYAERRDRRFKLSLLGSF